MSDDKDDHIGTLTKDELTAINQLRQASNRLPRGRVGHQADHPVGFYAIPLR